MRRGWLIVLLGMVCVAGVQAHVGSPDIYVDSQAGPYRLFITIRPPLVIPGVAELEVRSSTPGLRSLRAVPIPMTGAGARFAPIADNLRASPEDPQLFTGSLWMMQPGSWQVRISADGSAGAGSIAVPVPAAARTTKRMQSGLGAMLAVLGLFLSSSLVAMVGASVRESRLAPGTSPGAMEVRSGRTAMRIASLVVVAALCGGSLWWNMKASSYGQEVYKPMQMRAALTSPDILSLHLTDPGWLNDPRWHSIFTRSVDDLIPDHNHLMHLYVLRQPGLDLVYHLHPRQTGPGEFRLPLPSMPAGTYQLYADIVHANGFPETLASKFVLPASSSGRVLSGDDAVGQSRPWQQSSGTTAEFVLPDGYRMHWLGTPHTLHARQPLLFRFSLTEPSGKAPSDMALYMGMLGHAAFVRTNGGVFAHIHPSGTISMAAFMLAQEKNSQSLMPEMNMSEMSTGKHDVPSTMPASLPDQVSFPYGFPSPGHYRIIVQMKHGQTIETGIFDATVT